MTGSFDRINEGNWLLRDVTRGEAFDTPERKLDREQKQQEQCEHCRAETSTSFGVVSRATAIREMQYPVSRDSQGMAMLNGMELVDGHNVVAAGNRVEGSGSSGTDVASSAEASGLDQSSRTFDSMQSSTQSLSRYLENGVSSGDGVLSRYGRNEVVAQLPDGTLSDAGSANEGFVPGYKYTQQEAERRYRELCGSDDHSESDLQFMKAYRQKTQPEEAHFDAGNAPPESVREPSTKPLEVHTEQKKFELGSEASEPWKVWQERLNAEIHRKLQQLAKGSGVPLDAVADVTYRINADGSCGFNVTGNNAQYQNIVKRALEETFRYHPELLRFPAGSKESSVERRVPFDVRPVGGYQTGETSHEVIKKKLALLSFHVSVVNALWIKLVQLAVGIATLCSRRRILCGGRMAFSHS